MIDPQLGPAHRKVLRASLLAHIPWLARTDAGPQAVDAGSCDRCGAQPRLVPTCGPVAWPALCRSCVREIALDAWCDGHAEDGEAVLAWVDGLPPWWADAVILWWVATGELAWDGTVATSLPNEVQLALPARPRDD